MSKNSKKNRLSDISCWHKKFGGEKTFFWTCAKRQKNVSYKVILECPDLSFFAQVKKISFLHETFCANIKCLEIYTQILF